MGGEEDENRTIQTVQRHPNRYEQAAPRGGVLGRRLPWREGAGYSRHRRALEPLERLSAEFQSALSLSAPFGPPPGEVDTNVAAAPDGGGGQVAYQKVLEVPDDLDVLYITFSVQGQTSLGSALLMNTFVNGALCQPLAGSVVTKAG